MKILANFRSFYQKYTLIMFGCILFSLYFCNRFLRTRTDKTLPLTLRLEDLIAYYPIYLIFIIIIVSLIFPCKKKIKSGFDDIYASIREAILNPDLSASINLGISFDPGIDTSFITFHKQHLQYQNIFSTKEIKEILYTNSFDKKEHRKLIQRMIKNFPEEMQPSIQKAIEYIENK